MDLWSYFFSEDSKRLYILGRAVALVIGLVAGALSLAIGAHNYMRNVVDRGPAVLLRQVSVQEGWAGQTVRLHLKFDKIRPCNPRSATLQILDANNATHLALLNWVAPFPVKNDISAVLIYEIPNTLPKGITLGGQLEVWHHECSDGVDPETPVIINVPPLKVK